MTQRADIYTRVTNKIIADLEQGQLTWHKPWQAGHLEGRACIPVRHNGEVYQGINVLLLWSAAVNNGYRHNQWMTYKQAHELGGQVRKGEKGEQVVYANQLLRKEENDQGEAQDIVVPYMKAYTVFNVEQIDGLPERYTVAPEPINPDIQRDDRLEEFFAATGAEIRHGGSQAYYSVTNDYVQMPPIECFKDAPGYYAVLAHELTHWTRHESRLNRDFGRKRYGDEGYAREELVAELGAAFLCADLGLSLEPRSDHAAYIQSWLQVLKNDKRAIFNAASHAQKAVAFLGQSITTIEKE